MDRLSAAMAVKCSRTDLRVLRSTVDRRLKALLPTPRPGNALEEALRYGLLAPGKRIRPLLTLLTAWELGPDDLRALDAGCALEMVHAASLILDDLPSMDDAKLRRGQPALHVRFGEDVALLCAISLLARAFGTLGAAAHVEPSARCALVAILADAVGTNGLASGQYSDLREAAEMRRESCILDSNHLKTGTLFVAAVEMAAAIAGVGGERLGELRVFATHLGQAFQLVDDLADSPGTQLDGPEGGEDAGKMTLVAALGRAVVHHRIVAHVEQALAQVRSEGLLAEFVRTIFGSMGSLPPGAGERPDRDAST